MNKVTIIPLGQNCMPRTILTRWGVKPKKILGEVTFPFDLAVFETREITNLIKSDFKEFFYNLNYRESEKIWVKEPDCIEFRHDTKIKEQLIEKYTKRIENFRKAITADEPVLFVQILGDCSDVDNLYTELKRKRGTKPFKLAVIDTQNVVENANKEIVVLKIPYPELGYKNNWWKKEYYNSPEGRAFEKEIADFCLILARSF